MRLIDADALKEFIDDCGICAICPQKAPRCSYDCDFPDFVTEKWNVAIDAQPTIDAVSVVRCKECKHRPIKEDADGADYGFNVIAPNEDERCPCLVEDGWYSWIPKDDFYCGYGERESE